MDLAAVGHAHAGLALAAQRSAANQQMLAAWVSAGAAIAQAAGAIAAIWFTVKMAREAEARGAAAERASLARADAADRAAAERVAAAERASQERLERENRERRNRPIRLVRNFVPPVLAQLDLQIAEASKPGLQGQVIGGFDGVERARLEQTLSRLLAETHEVEVTMALEALRDAGGPYVNRNSMKPSAYAWQLCDYRRRLVEAMEKLDALLLS